MDTQVCFSYFEMNCLLNALDREIKLAAGQERFELVSDGTTSDGGRYKSTLQELQGKLFEARQSVA